MINYDENSTIDKVYFTKLIFLATLPIIIFIASFAFWSIVKIFKKNKTYIESYFISTITILFFLIVPNLTRASFSVLNCRYIEDMGYYLVDDLEIECWEGEHLVFGLITGLFIIIVWLLIIPTFTSVYLAKNIRFDLH